MALPSDAPDYLKTLPTPSSEEFWRRIHARFDQLVDTVRHARLQTHTQATGVRQAPGVWRSTGNQHDAGALPYLSGVDQVDLPNRIQRAVELADILDGLIANRVPTLEFAYQWGVFCELAGSIELLAISGPSDMQGDRSRLTKGAAQKKWVALQLLSLTSEGMSRLAAEAEVVRRVRLILAREPDAQFPHPWYRQIVTPRGSLRPAFTSAGGRLTAEGLGEAARGPFAVPSLPPAD
jgi:hypothetical protein